MKRKTLAIPVRCVDFSNSSQVVSLFTRDAGLLDGIAKGAHREKNPFQGPFDLCVLYEAVFIDRRSEALAILTEASVVEGFRGLRRRWDRHMASSHVVEFVRAIAVAGEGDADMFDLVASTLGALSASSGERIGPILARFDTRALQCLGLLGPLGACVSCGRAWPGGEKPVFISPRAGGILCTACRSGPERAPGLSIPGGALRMLDRLLEPGEAALGGEELAALDEGWKAYGRPVKRLVSELRTNLLERDLVLLKSSTRWI